MEIKWHSVDEKPQYDEHDIFKNGILVCGETSQGKGMACCSILDEGATIFCPLNEKEYDWGKCYFTHWAYCHEIYPNQSTDS